MNKLFWLSLGFTSLVFISLRSQSTAGSDCSLTIPAIALLDIEPANPPIVLYLDPPSEAGAPLTIGDGGANSTKWLNYTSALMADGPARTVTVKVTSGTVPPGVNLRVQAGPYTGAGAGTLGLSAGLVTLDNTAKTILTGIGGSYTGDGPNNGHLLTYSISIADYSLLDFSSSAVLQVTYTISD